MTPLGGIALFIKTQSKNRNYDAAYNYLTSKPVLDEKGKRIPREIFIIKGINCNPTSFGRECEDLNLRYGKNKKSSEIKHHYIISFDPRDRDGNGLTSKQDQALGHRICPEEVPWASDSCLYTS